MDQKKTGVLIAKARKEKGLTQEQLANRLHVSHTTVSKWERGLGFPEVSLLEPLAAELGLTLDELFKGAELPAEPQNEAETPQQDNTMKIVLICLLVVFFLGLIGIVEGQRAPKYSGDPDTIRGCWQHVPERSDAEPYLVTLSADLQPGERYELYIDNRLVDEGTWTERENRTFFLDGELLDFTAEITWEKSYAQFILHLPGLEQPLYMRKRGDFNISHVAPQYTDRAEYQKLLIGQ